MIAFLAAFAGLGWGVALLFIGLWIGERRARRWVENMHFFGTPNALQKAVVSVPVEPEDRIDEAIDEATGVTSSGRRVRIVRPEDSQPAFSEATVENGVEYLLEDARKAGVQLSREEARDEVMRMLNAEGAEI